MPIQTFSMKQLLCKILKTKNCVPFEVLHYSSVIIYKVSSTSKSLIPFYVPNQISGYYSVALPHGAVVWPAVCDGGIF